MCGRESAPRRRLLVKAAPGHERLHADRPQPPLLVEAQVTFLLECSQEAMGGRSREAYLLGEHS